MSVGQGSFDAGQQDEHKAVIRFDIDEGIVDEEFAGGVKTSARQSHGKTSIPSNTQNKENLKVSADLKHDFREQEGSVQQKSAMHKSSMHESHFTNTRQSPVKDIVQNEYHHDNMPLRPYLSRGSSMKNVEDNVETLRQQDINYLMVLEDKPYLLENVGLMCAPNKVTRYTDAKHRESEYSGRPTQDDKPQKTAYDMIPVTPHSLDVTLNAEDEERRARERQQKKEIIAESFASRLQAKVEKRKKRKERKFQKELEKQIIVFKHIINRQVESPYRMRQDAIKRKEAQAEEDADGPAGGAATIPNSSQFGGSSAPAGKSKKDGGDDPTRYVPQEYHNPPYLDVLKHVFNARNIIGTKGTARPKKRGGRGGGISDQMSYRSGAETAKTNQAEEENLSEYDKEQDFMCYGQKKRSYSVKKPTIDLIGVSNFDACKTKKDLNFTLDRAYRRYKKRLHTTDTKRIKQVIKQGIVRDTRSIIIRNLAIQWKENQKQKVNENKSEGRNSSMNKTNQSYSPQKSILGPGTQRGGSPSKVSMTGRSRAKSDGGLSNDVKSPHAKSTVGFAVPNEGPGFNMQKVVMGETMVESTQNLKLMDQYPWNLELEEIEAKIIEEENEKGKVEKEIRKNIGKEESKATTKVMKEAAKRKAAKANAPFLEELEKIKRRIVELQEVYEYKTPLQDKLPKDSVFYKHYMQRIFCDKLEDAAQKQVEDDKNLMDNIKTDINK